MKNIPREKQIALMWEYHDNANLQLVYKTFDAFVLCRTKDESR